VRHCFVDFWEYAFPLAAAFQEEARQMNPLAGLASVGVFCLAAITVAGQGTFQNLDFEAANVAAYSTGDPLVLVQDALPGWTAYYDGMPTSTVCYDTRSLGSAVISINDIHERFGFVPFEGNYSASLEGNSGSASMGQWGEIPGDSLSVVFYYRGEYVGHFDVSFGGQVLPFTAIGSEADYSICAADISAYAGQMGELRFTEANGGRAIIDDIHFSAEAVPEPCTAALFVLGAIALIGRFVWRKV
jgi:hypothetical protein